MTTDSTPPTEPDDWKTADDPSTDTQRVYLDTLARETGEPAPDENLTKAEASEKIDELRHKAGFDEDDQDIDIRSDPELGGDE